MYHYNSVKPFEKKRRYAHGYKKAGAIASAQRSAAYCMGSLAWLVTGVSYSGRVIWSTDNADDGKGDVF